MHRSHHLRRLRESSAYPIYRALVGLLTSVTLLLAVGLVALGLWLATSLGQTNGGWASVGAGLLLALWALVLREVLLMVADRTDATLDLAARAAEQGPK